MRHRNIFVFSTTIENLLSHKDNTSVTCATIKCVYWSKIPLKYIKFWFSFYTFSVSRILWIFWKYINEIWLDKTSFQLFFIIKKLYVKLVKKNIEYGGKVSLEFYSLKIKTSGTYTQFIKRLNSTTIELRRPVS